jgi:tRNA-dihydrouridine synthase B
MRDEALVGRILDAVVRAVEVPVTLKIRTGWARAHRNGLAIARIAEAAGIQALAVHGRTREDLYQGEADYGLIAEIKSELRVPVLANGDIDSPEKAAAVLRVTGADAVMIGRAAQGRPWIFREIAHFLATGEHLPEPGLSEVRDILLGHLDALYAFYGEAQGLRIARKHLGWYARDVEGGEAFRTAVNAITTAEAQTALARDWFEARAAGLVLDRAA